MQVNLLRFLKAPNSHRDAARLLASMRVSFADRRSSKSTVFMNSSTTARARLQVRANNQRDDRSMYLVISSSTSARVSSAGHGDSQSMKTYNSVHELQDVFGIHEIGYAQMQQASSVQFYKALPSQDRPNVT